MSGAVRIGTRGSQLALWQANEVARQLSARGIANEIVVVRTTGDKRQDVPLAAIGGKGLFIKELEEALERNEIDVAVHSLKDVPSIVPPQFALAAFLARADARDAWVHPQNVAIETLPAGSKVGTSSPRRRAQLCARFPKLHVEPVRGNVETRISKARAGEFAGVILACAGLDRLALSAQITRRFAVDAMVPAAGQGIVALETLRERASIAASINVRESEIAAKCERGVLERFGERLDCYSAIAVHATVSGGINIHAFVGDLDGTQSIRSYQSGSDAQRVVEATFTDLAARGAQELLFARG